MSLDCRRYLENMLSIIFLVQWFIIKVMLIIIIQAVLYCMENLEACFEIMLEYIENIDTSPSTIINWVDMVISTDYVSYKRILKKNDLKTESGAFWCRKCMFYTIKLNFSSLSFFVIPICEYVNVSTTSWVRWYKNASKTITFHSC